MAHLGPISSKYVFLRSDTGHSPILPSLGPLLLLGPPFSLPPLLTLTSLPLFSLPLLCSAFSLLGPPPSPSHIFILLTPIKH